MTLHDLATTSTASVSEIVQGVVIQTPSSKLPRFEASGAPALVIIFGTLAVTTWFVVRFFKLRRQSRDALARLKVNEARYRLLFDGNPCPMWVYDVETTAIVEVNDAATAQYGYTREEFTTMSLRDLRAPDDVVRQEGMLQGLAGESESIHFARHLKKDGTAIEVEARGRPLPIPGRLLRLVVVTDYTARLATERTAREAEARARATSEMLQSLIDAAPQAMIVIDAAMYVRRWNRAAEALFGWSAEEVLGKPVPFIPPDKRGEADARLIRAIAGDSLSPTEVTRVRKDGTLVHLLVAAASLLDAHGCVVGLITIFTDLTERNLLEAQLRQSQKMEAVGTLAGGVAHDFNNLLTVILSYSEMLLSGTLAPEYRSDLEEISTAARRATALTRQLLTFSRKAIVQLRSVDINEVVRGMHPMFRRLLTTNIDLSTTLSANACVVVADPSQIEQVLMNLVVNASDAMPHGGSLAIETQNVELDRAYVQTHAGVRPGPYVMLAVADTGIGMDAATVSKAFEPFFTTKDVGRGTGLGLATVYAITKQLEGHVWVYSEPGHGATFKIYLPRHASTVADEVARAPRAREVLRAGTALLVEDDDAVRRAVRRMLERLGYSVLEASDGETGLSVATGYAGTIDVVITDLMMPRMNGGDFAAALAKTHPSLRVVFASGYTDDTVVRRGLLTDEHLFLQKPFTADQLAQAISKLRSTQ
ncbi:MAG: PAS domain S-box protein [bacterium]